MSSWIRPSIVGWWVWAPATIALGSYLIWLQIRRPQQSYTPLVFAGLFLVSCIAHYLRSDWHQYLGRQVLWLSGVVSILIIAPLPLAITLLAERGTVRVIQRPLVRGCLAVTLALAITVLMQQPLAFWAARLVIHAGR
jgi:hypothetical protein